MMSRTIQRTNRSLGCTIARLTSIGLIFSLLAVSDLASSPKNKGGKKTTPVPMESVHFSGFAIQPQAGLDQGSGALYSDGNPGTSILLEGGTYNLRMQCPLGAGTCQRAFEIYITSSQAGCDSPIDLPTARMTIWVDNLQECGPVEDDPPLICGEPYSSTARAQIRELIDGGVIENGFGAELNWDNSLGGSDVYVTTNTDGSWDIEGTNAVIISGKGRNRTTCSYNASFSLNTRPQ